jgi:cyclase
MSIEIMQKGRRRILCGALIFACGSAGAQIHLDPEPHIVPEVYLDEKAALDAINANATLQFFPVAGNVYLLADPRGGTNVTVQIGDEGVLVVDSGSSENAAETLAMVQRISSEPLRYLLNTTGLPAYTGANEEIGTAGVGYEGVGARGTGRTSGIAHENAMIMMATNPEPPNVDTGYPNLAFFNTHQPIFFNGETIDIFYQPNANTNSESIVVFRRSDVISAGPVFLTTTYPKIYPEEGGTIDGVIEALNSIIDITNTRKNQEGGTMVISGEGRITDESGVSEYRDMLTIIRERIRYYMDLGMSLDDIRAARPTMDYDGRYGSGTGPAAPENFLELIFNELLENRGDQ